MSTQVTVFDRFLRWLWFLSFVDLAAYEYKTNVNGNLDLIKSYF